MAINWIVFPDGDLTGVPLGGKARALAELSRAGFPVPEWFVVTPAAFLACREAQAPGSDELPGITGEVLDALDDALERLGGERYAVRSSAVEEDSAQHSFAGQLESFLFVPREGVAERVAAVWRSAFSERVRRYREERGLSPVPQAPAVLVQRMVEAEAAGVAFGADPVSGARSVRVISAVLGLGSTLVAGETDADTWHLDRDGHILQRDIAHKPIVHRYDPAAPQGVSAVPVLPGRAATPALTDAQLRAVARLVEQAGEHFAAPQDIEWAYAGGRLHLLQSRPITSLAPLPDPDGALILWDNSNITESYAGITTPLTFSFARRAYEAVYREFCRIMGVPAARIALHDNLFRNMLGLIRGRVYYNLSNWYRVLALLPGFTVNRRFMEQMMGVRESLPDSVAAELARAGRRERLLDSLYLVRSAGALLLNHWLLPRKIARFYARLDEALTPHPAALSGRRIDELAADYRVLERRLLTRWDAPLINDFLAMIFFGVLRRLCQSWCDDAAGTLQNDLLSGEGGLISAEPARHMRELARLAAQEPVLVGLLEQGEAREVQRALPRHPALAAAYQDYLARFGDRCLEELKLESPTLHDDPTPLLRAVARLAQRPEAVPPPAATSARQRAEARVAQALRGKGWRGPVFRWVLKHARRRIRDRENLRFERTRLFGRVRRIVLELGRRLYALGRLDTPREVFYLEVEEVLGFVEGTATMVDLARLARLRRSEFDGYRQLPAPADRFETRGAVHQGHAFTAVHTAAGQIGESGAGDEARQGLGCYPGRVRGPVRVVVDPRTARIRQGEILVAQRTDPGWVMLFPACTGLLVERGSLLSHSAIVAREMGLPAIVSIPGLTDWLADGDWVEMDGASGQVRRLAPQAGSEHVA